MHSALPTPPLHTHLDMPCHERSGKQGSAPPSSDLLPYGQCLSNGTLLTLKCSVAQGPHLSRRERGLSISKASGKLAYSWATAAIWQSAVLSGKRAAGRFSRRIQGMQIVALQERFTHLAVPAPAVEAACKPSHRQLLRSLPPCRVAAPMPWCPR
jgi:hypothetical protein